MIVNNYETEISIFSENLWESIDRLGVSCLVVYTWLINLVIHYATPFKYHS